MGIDIDMKAYNALAVRVASLESATRQLTPTAKYERAMLVAGIIADSCEANLWGHIKDLLSQHGHDSWLSLKLSRVENAEEEWEGCGLEDGYECDHCDGGSV